MPRSAHEFWCNECKHYNYPTLSDEMFGNYTIQCGNCQHHHYRVIKRGVVTADRHDERYGTADVIHVPKSATSKEQRKLGSVAQFRQMEAAGRAS